MRDVDVNGETRRQLKDVLVCSMSKLANIRGS